jgi:hypothetical protein
LPGALPALERAVSALSQCTITDHCPTGVATQDRTRQRALVVPDKLDRVANFHASTMHSLMELTAAAGFDHPREFGLHHFCRRVSTSEVKTFEDLYPPLAAGELLEGTKDPRFRDAWMMASATDFRPLAAVAVPSAKVVTLGGQPVSVEQSGFVPARG